MSLLKIGFTYICMRYIISIVDIIQIILKVMIIVLVGMNYLRIESKS